MFELADIEAESCPGCGWHPSLMTDEVPFGPEEHICPVCAGETQFRRHLSAEDKKWDVRHEKAAPLDPRPSDGRHVRMAALSPEEAQKRRGGGGGDTH